MGHLSMLIEDMDKKLLTIKIINRSKSLKNKVLVWFYQVARGIREILSYAKKGIKELEKDREKRKNINKSHSDYRESTNEIIKKRTFFGMPCISV